MRPSLILATSAFLITAAGCPAQPPSGEADREPAAPPAQSQARPAAQPSSQPSSGPASAPSGRGAEVAARVKAARARLEASEAGRRVLASTEAHGGLAAWYGLETLGFRYDYRPTKGPRRDSFQIVDLLRSVAWHQLHAPVKGHIAFDGEEAWMKLEGDANYPARFWALTPYYFVGMPFVLSDPGVVLTLSEDDPTQAGFPKGTAVVRAEFTDGTGDAPDDYYVLYLAEGTDALLGLRYVVSYAPFMKPGMAHTPEKLLVYEQAEPLGELNLARRHRFFAFADGRRGDPASIAEVSELQPSLPLGEAQLRRPDGARVDTSLAPN